MNSESFGKQQDIESDTQLELISNSNTTKPWDARSREFPNQIEPKSAAMPPVGVMKQVEVEVKYTPEAAHMSQMTHSDQV